MLEEVPIELSNATSLERYSSILSFYSLYSYVLYNINIYLFHSFVRLYLKGNQLSSIPAEYTQLINLRLCDITANKFTDTPTHLITMKHLHLISKDEEMEKNKNNNNNSGNNSKTNSPTNSNNTSPNTSPNINYYMNNVNSTLRGWNNKMSEVAKRINTSWNWKQAS